MNDERQTTDIHWSQQLILSTKCSCELTRLSQKNIIAPDKAFFFNPKLSTFLLFVYKNICCGYSLEAPQWGTSDEYPQRMFSWGNKKNLPLLSGARNMFSYFSVQNELLVLSRSALPRHFHWVPITYICGEIRKISTFCWKKKQTYTELCGLSCSHMTGVINIGPAEPGYVPPLQTV